MKATPDFTEITVFGARGHSLVILRGMEEFWQGRVRIRALVADLEHGFIHPVLDVPVVSSVERAQRFAELPVLLTPGSGSLRARMASRFGEEGATLATASCPGQLHVDPTARFGPGCLCMSFTRLGPNVSIGAGAQVLASVLAHDVTVGDFATVGSGVCVSGHVEIGAGAHIGPQAVISNGTRDRPLRIGAGAIVGTGAAVLRDVPPGARVIGNPAMPLRDWVRLQRLAQRG